MRVVPVLLVLVCLMMAAPSFATQAKTGFIKATVGRAAMGVVPDASELADGPTPPDLLFGLDGYVLEEYADFSLIEIHDADKDTLKHRGAEQSVLVTLSEEFDRNFLNGRTLDAREGPNKIPSGDQADPPYAGDEQGAWHIQFIGPVKASWMEFVKAAGIVPVQYIPFHAYIVAGRESEINVVASLPFVQWTSQMHRFLKPSIEVGQEQTVWLWIELAQTDGTADVVALLEKLAEGEIEAAPFSDEELRVQGVFRTADLDLILAEPLVIGLAHRPEIAFSDERSALGVTNMVPSAGSPSPQAGKYKKWLGDLCPSCTNLKNDGFYLGIADSGLDGGDRVASGTLPGEGGSSDLHRSELLKSRVGVAPEFRARNGRLEQLYERLRLPRYDEL